MISSVLFSHYPSSDAHLSPFLKTNRNQSPRRRCNQVNACPHVPRPSSISVLYMAGPSFAHILCFPHSHILSLSFSLTHTDHRISGSRIKSGTAKPASPPSSLATAIARAISPSLSPVPSSTFWLAAEPVISTMSSKSLRSVTPPP